MSTGPALELAVGAGAGLAVAPGLTLLIRRAVASRSAGVERRPAPAPVVAAVTSVAFAATAGRFGLGAELAAYLFLVALLVVLSFVDLATKTLPRRLVHAALIGGVLLLTPLAALTGEPERTVWATVGALGAYLALTVLHLAARGGFGYGDVRLGAALGWYLAWQGIGYLTIGFFLAFALSAVIGLGLMACGRVGRRTAIPFGPFLAAGALLALVGGPALVSGA